LPKGIAQYDAVYHVVQIQRGYKKSSKTVNTMWGGGGAAFGLLGFLPGKEAGAKIHKDIKQLNV
jgi:hypothetical protein